MRGPARARGEPVVAVLTVADGGPRVATDLEVADTWLARAFGWLGRRSFPAGRALWLPRARAIHTFGMRGPIDVAFLGADGAVLAVRRRLAPWRVAVGPAGTAVAVEFPPGALARAGVRPGVRLERRRRPAGDRA